MHSVYLIQKLTKIVFIIIGIFAVNIFFEYKRFNFLENNLRQLNTDIVRLTDQIQTATADINNFDCEENYNVDYVSD
jgi:hypothetical protein